MYIKLNRRAGYMIKHTIEIFFNIPLFIYKKHSRSKIILILTPQYLNWGDHAIALSEKKLIREKYPNIELLEINLSFYKLWPQRVRKIIDSDDFIIITGGGYIGDIWEDVNTPAEHIISTYRNNQIMLAPQTIFFQNKEKEQLFSKLIKSHGKIYTLAREDNTYQFLINQMGHEPEIDCNVVPDMAMFLKIKINDTLRKKAALCFRTDYEKIVSESDIKIIKKSLDNVGISSVHMKMFYLHVEIPTWLRTCFVKWKLKQYIRKKIVVTDRLHSMIFAAITATPCVAFDNMSRKISGVYEKWMKDLPYIKVIDSVQKFETALQDVTRDYNRKKILTAWQNKLQTENMKLIWKELDEWNQRR